MQPDTNDQKKFQRFYLIYMSIMPHVLYCKDAYEITEYIWIKTHGTSCYKNLSSFKSTMSYNINKTR